MSLGSYQAGHRLFLMASILIAMSASRYGVCVFQNSLKLVFVDTCRRMQVWLACGIKAWGDVNALSAHFYREG